MDNLLKDNLKEVNVFIRNPNFTGFNIRVKNDKLDELENAEKKFQEALSSESFLKELRDLKLNRNLFYNEWKKFEKNFYEIVSDLKFELEWKKNK